MFTSTNRFPLLLLSILFTHAACTEPDSDEFGDPGPPPSTSGHNSSDGEGDDSDPPPTSSTSEQMCEKYDYCNLLGTGLSIDDCAYYVEGCVAGMPSGAQVDWWSAADACLEKQDCGNYIECMYDQGTCSLLTCHSDCDWCHLGTEAQGNCPSEWYGDGECDCGCQWSDVDCG